MYNISNLIFSICFSAQCPAIDLQQTNRCTLETQNNECSTDSNCPQLSTGQMQSCCPTPCGMKCMPLQNNNNNSKCQLTCLETIDKFNFKLVLKQLIQASASVTNIVADRFIFISNFRAPMPIEKRPKKNYWSFAYVL